MASTGYTAWSVTAGEQPTTAYWNILGTNDQSFNTGTGFNDGILVARHFSNGGVPTPAMKPTFYYYDGTTLNSGSGTRSTFGSSGVAPGCSVSYTTGVTNEVLYIGVSGLMSTSAAGGVCGIAVNVNGSSAGHRTYYQNNAAGQWLTQSMTHYLLATANTTYTIGIYVWVDSPTVTLCNSNTDHGSSYDPELMIMSWSR